MFNPTQFSPQELQELHFMVRSKAAFRRYLGLTIRQANQMYQEKTVCTPVIYIQNLESPLLLRGLASYGSLKAVGIRYGVSTAFLKTELATRGFSRESQITNPAWSDELPDELVRLGSVAFFCQVNQVKPSAVRTWFKDHELNINEYIDIELSGSNTSAKGRKAELAYQTWRSTTSSPVTKDLNLVEGSQADYDFEVEVDSRLTRVNVKSSRQFQTKGTFRTLRQPFWKISLSSLDKADLCGVVLFDAEFNLPLYAGDLSASTLLETGARTLTIYLSDLETLGLNILETASA